MDIVIGLLISALILGFALFYFRKSNIKYKHETTDLATPVQLRFVKNAYREYVVQFYNPIVKSWWTLPDGYAYVHSHWSLRNKGSYGAYSLEIMEVNESSIPSIKAKYKTLVDIQKYFDEINKKHDEVLEKDRIDAAKPKVIY